jgi:hypothetical protein
MNLIFKLALVAGTFVASIGVPDVPRHYEFHCECHGDVRGVLVNWKGAVFTPVNSVTEAEKWFEAWVDTSPDGPLLKARKVDPDAHRAGPAICHRFIP